jgi:hypothetical protein
MSIKETIQLQYKNQYCGCVLCQLCNKKIYRTGKNQEPCCKLDSEDMQKQSDNLCEYLDKVVKFIDENKSENNPKPIKLAIVGKDPYPDGALGLPFAKKDMSSQDKCDSGYVILWALGIKFFPQNENDVNKLFKELLQKGIVFLNVSYKYLGKREPLKKSVHLPYLQCANSINKAILNHAQSVLLCNSAKNGFLWPNNLNKKTKPTNFRIENHPSGNNARQWKQTWARHQGCLVKLFSNKLEIKCSIMSINRILRENIIPKKPLTLYEKRKKL